MTHPLPRKHWNYDEIDNEKSPCQCVLCVNYRATIPPYLKATESSADHGISCRCSNCKERRRTEINMLVADNKKTLWSEGCFISLHKPWRESFLDWLEKKILNDDWALSARRKNTNYFWVHEAERIETGTWLEEWHQETNSSQPLMSAGRLLK